MSACEWCVDPDAQEAKDPSRLCLFHEAEYEGLTVDSLSRRDRGEWLDQQ